MWNANGTLQASVDGRGLRATHNYDITGNMVSTLYSDGWVLSYTYNTFRRRITVTEALGHSKQFRYDLDGRQTTLINEAGGIVTMVYDSRGNLLTTSETGVVVAHAYDAALRRMTETEGHAAPGWVLAPWPAHRWVDTTLHHHPTLRGLLEEQEKAPSTE